MWILELIGRWGVKKCMVIDMLWKWDIIFPKWICLALHIFSVPAPKNPLSPLLRPNHHRAQLAKSHLHSLWSDLEIKWSENKGPISSFKSKQNVLANKRSRTWIVMHNCFSFHGIISYTECPLTSNEHINVEKVGAFEYIWRTSVANIKDVGGGKEG